MRRKKLDPMTIVIDVGGGVVQAVFSDLPIKVILVDGDGAVPFAREPFSAMKDDTYTEVINAPKGDEGKEHEERDPNPSYWCEPCRSFHVDPTSKAHHKLLQCRAPYKRRKAKRL